MKKFLKEYWIEIGALIILSLGIFLLVERMEIRSTIWQTILNAKTLFQSEAELFVKGMIVFVGNFTLSDTIGTLFVILAVIFVLWRIRYRFLHSDFWLATTCPKCGSELHRVHRSKFDHFLSRTVLPKSHRYECSNPECNWSGLRRRGRRKREKELS